MNLTEHFTLAELTHTDHRELENTPNESEAVNTAVGSKNTSQHRIGAACDFRVPGMAPDAVVRAIIAADLPYDQIIREFDAWTHISVPNTAVAQPRQQALIIDRAGVRPFA